MFRDQDLDCYDIQPNATCQDCSVDYSRAEDDTTPYCDACSDRRDAHTSLLQTRFIMAKALANKSPLAPALKLTSGEIASCVALLGIGVTLEKAIDKIQTQRSRQPLPFVGGEAA